MSADVADVLDKAAEVIEVRGWHRGDLFNSADGTDDGECAVCAWGALLVVKKAAHDPVTVEERRALLRYLGVGSVAEWNDDPARTEDEVIVSLRAAAATERARP